MTPRARAPAPADAALVSLIARINASTRRCVITRQPGGGYQPSQFG